MTVHQTIADRYEILELIDEGGMGQVFRAQDTQTGEIVAIKALKDHVVAQDPTLVDRFCREALLLRKLNHPNIVRVYDTFEEKGRHYIIMEYISGGSLARVLRQSGAMPVERVVALSLDLADALTRTHRMEIIHRDLKPGNVLLAEDGTPRLTDFGVAHIGDGATIMTQVGSLLGTIAYLAPEVTEGHAHNEKSDIWSFGLTLYEMLTGRHAFIESTPATMLTAIMRKPVPDVRALRPEVPEDLMLLLDRMLAKNPDDRIGSVREIGAELERILVMLRREAAELRGIDATPPASRFSATPATPQPAVFELNMPNHPTTVPPASPNTPASSSAGLTPSQTNLPFPATPLGATPIEPRTTRVLNPRLFIAYRREDSGEIAGRLYEQLSTAMGENGVVRDVDRFADRTVSRYVLANDVVGSVDVILVLIGPGWVGMPRDKRASVSGRAIDNPKDSVRMQIEAGLRRPDILLIPVLVNDGVLPDQLPASLEGLRDMTPFVIASDQPLEAQVRKLVRTINDHFGLTQQTRSPLIWGAVALLAVLVLVAVMLLLSALTGAAPGATPAAVAPVAPGEYMVLVADLEAMQNSTRSATRLIVDDLTERFERQTSISPLRVRRLNRVIASADQARAAADEVGATVVVWGNYGDDVVELQIQIGSLAAFPTMPFERADMERIGNVRARLTDERTQTVASQVLTILTLLQNANGDGYEQLRTLVIHDEMNITPAEIVGGGAAALTSRALAEFFNDTPAALTTLDEAIGLEAGSPNLYVVRALARQRVGDFSGASQDLDTAERLAPNWVQPNYLRANSYIFQGNYAAAAAAYDPIVAARPHDWFPVNYRGAIYYALGDYAQAKRDLEASIALQPTANFPYPFAAFIAMREARIMDARGYMRTILTEFPDPTLATRTLTALYGDGDAVVWGPIFSGFTNLLLGQHNQVLLDVERALAMRPDLADLYAMKGLAYCNMNEKENAEAAYTQGLAIEPAHPLLLILRAEVRGSQNMLLPAFSDVTAAFMNDDNGELQNMMSDIDLTCINFFSSLVNDDLALPPAPLS